MKKVVVFFLLMTMMISLVGCGTREKEDQGNKDQGNVGTENNQANQGNQTNQDNNKAGYELALVTDIGTIDDKSFNQGSWEGLKQYAEENNITYKYYQPTEKTTDAYLDQIELAVEGGAKVVVCPGYLFEEAVYFAQDEFPDIKFIILDGQPHDANYEDFKINDNVYSIFYAEQEAGFLAGYAAVKEGFTKLGFMGGMAVPAVIRFGYGFVQGADFAAKELGIDSVDLKYHYTGGFNASPEVQAMAASWYQAGTEVIFACGGAVGNSVMAAAEASGAKVIGVDVDQSNESDTVITSAMKMLSGSVYDAITDYYGGNFPGGQVVTRTAKEDGVGLPMNTSRFETFTQEDYDAIYQKLLSGEVTPVTDADAEDAKAVPVEIVAVEVIG